MTDKKEKITFTVQSGLQTKAFNCDADIILFGGAAGCVSNDTEFLTENGWKRIDQYQKGDKVLQYNADTNTASFVDPVRYIKLPCEKLTHFKANGISQVLSEEHRVLYYNDHAPTKAKVISFKEMRRRHENSLRKGFTGKFKTTFEYSGSGINMTEGELRLQVAVRADGRIVKEGANNYTQMRFSKTRKYERLIEILNKYNLPYKDNGCKPHDRYLNGKAYEVIVFPKNREKRFTADFYNCTKEQLEIIFDEIFHWDGSFVENMNCTTRRYFSKYKEDADFVQFMAHSLGYNTSLIRDNREGKTSYTVNVQETGKGFRCMANCEKKAPMIDVIPEDGFKYCFEVPSSFFVIRHDNKVVITGNSGKSHLLMLKALHMAYNDPGFAGIIFRRNMPQMTGQGGMWLESQRMFAPLKPTIKRKDHIIQFNATGGGSIKYAGMDHEMDYEQHQGLKFVAPFTCKGN